MTPAEYAQLDHLRVVFGWLAAGFLVSSVAAFVYAGVCWRRQYSQPGARHAARRNERSAEPGDPLPEIDSSCYPPGAKPLPPTTSRPRTARHDWAQVTDAPLPVQVAFARLMQAAGTGSTKATARAWDRLLFQGLVDEEIVVVCLELAERAREAWGYQAGSHARPFISLQNGRKADDPDAAVADSPTGKGALAAMRVIAAHTNDCDDMARAIVAAIIDADESLSSPVQYAFFAALAQLATGHESTVVGGS
ncbi:hypothetical protein [Angustibacter luteus]|uniref:Secreted protein n=1 Tax=Angustibacter luteus TaxID=658456 RepID=A0ABW1JKC2_9ACTN